MTHHRRHRPPPAPTPAPTPPPTPPPPAPAPAPTPTPTGLRGVYHGAYIDGATMGRYYGASYNYTVPSDPGGIVQTQFETDAGKTIALCMFGQGSGSTEFWNPTGGNLTAAQIVANFNVLKGRSVYPMLDISSAYIDLTAITAGTYDTQITAWFNTLKTYNAPWVLRLNTEMNTDNYPYGKGRANQEVGAGQIVNYKNAWIHIWNIAQSVGANTNCTWHWAPNYVPPWDYGTGDAYDFFKEYYPGGQYVDWAGWVGYLHSATRSEGDWWWLMAPSYQMCLEVAPGKPLMVSEWGSYREITGPPANPAHGTDATKGQWLQHALEHVRDHQPAIRAMVLFNTGYAPSGPFSEIESSAAAMAGYRAGISDPLFLGKQAALALSGKVPVPAR